MSSLVTLGPAPFFPIAGAVVVAAILGGLTQRGFRDFGAAGTTVKIHSIRGFAQLRVSVRACGPCTFGLIRRQMAHGGMDPFSGPRRQSEHGARDVALEFVARSLRRPAMVVQRAHACGMDGRLAGALRELLG